MIGKGPLLMIMGRCWSQICQHLSHGNFITSGYFKAIFNIKRLSLKPGAALSVFSWVATGLAIMAMSTFTASAGGRGGLDCNKNLPPGDYYLNPVTGCYVPWDSSNAPKTDFVNLGNDNIFGTERLSSYPECQNGPDLYKNINRLHHLENFLRTSFVDKKMQRCSVVYGAKASSLDKIFQATGSVFDEGGLCSNLGGGYCNGSGTLVGNLHTVVTNAHVFHDALYGFTLSPEDIVKEVTVSFKVWIPPGKRKNPNEHYEFRAYPVVAAFVATDDALGDPNHDFAFLRLGEDVSTSIDGVEVPKEYQISPIQNYKDDDQLDLAKEGYLAGFHVDKEYVLQKSCSPFKLVELKGGLMHHRAFTTRGASGGGIFSLDRIGQPYFRALHRGIDEKSGGKFNLAISAKEIGPLLEQFIRDPNGLTRESIASK